MSRVPKTPGFVAWKSPVFWVFAGLVILGIYWQVTDTLDKWGDYPGGIVSALVVWLVYGLVVGWLLYKLQLFERRPLSTTVAMVAWGALVAGGVAAVSGEELRSLGDKVFGYEASRDWGPAYRAPLLEETMKYLGVVALALIPRARLTRVIDGVFYGAMSGFGFLLSENFFFSNQDIAGSGGTNIGGEITGVVFLRGIASLPLSHVVYSAIAGAGVGYVVSRRGRSPSRRVAVAAGLYATAFLLHGFQNSPILEETGGSLFIKGAPALLAFLLVVRWARNEYRRDLSDLAGRLPQITEEDMDRLASRRRRRTSAKASTATKEARRSQRRQVGLLVATDIYGTPSPEVSAATAALVLAAAAGE